MSVAQKEHRHIYPEARLGRARSDRALAQRRGGAPARSPTRGCDASRSGRAGHRQPARDDRRLGPRDRRAAAQRDQLAGHAHRSPGRELRPSTAARSSASAPGCRRRPTSRGPSSAGCSTTCRGCASGRSAGEVAVRDDRLLADLAADRRRHVTDVTNASRTMMMSLQTLDWDDELLAALDVPRAMLPEIRSSAEIYGEAARPAGGSAGRRGARRPAGGAVRPDLLRARRGQVHVRHGQLPAAQHRRAAGRSRRTVCSRPSPTSVGDEPPVYALEGSIAVTGALVQWFRDNLGLIGTRAGDRDAGAQRRRQRRLLLRARVLRAVRAALAPRRARRDRRPHRLHHQGPPRPRRAGGDRLADARGGRGDDRRLGRRR